MYALRFTNSVIFAYYTAFFSTLFFCVRASASMLQFWNNSRFSTEVACLYPSVTDVFGLFWLQDVNRLGSVENKHPSNGLGYGQVGLKTKPTHPMSSPRSRPNQVLKSFFIVKYFCQLASSRTLVLVWPFPSKASLCSICSFYSIKKFC